MIPARTHTAAYMQTLYTGEMTPAHKKGEHMTAIDLTSFVEDYETAETGAHKHALDIAYIWSKLRTASSSLS